MIESKDKSIKNGVDINVQLSNYSKWVKFSSIILTIFSSLSYVGLYFVIPKYQQYFEAYGTKLPIFTRVILNIYQTYLSVFIIVSVSLLVLFFVKVNRGKGNYKPVFALIVINFVIAAVLFGVTVIGVNK